MPNMSQTTEPAAEPPNPGEPPRPQERSGQLGKAAAWVGIVAGVVFIVGVIFFAGFWLAQSRDGYGDNFGRPHGHMTSSDMSNSCPMMESGKMMAPGGMKPGQTAGPPATPAPEAPRNSG